MDRANYSIGANVESKLLQLEQIVRANYWSKAYG
jgi:hypothetical protein